MKFSTLLPFLLSSVVSASIIPRACTCSGFTITAKGSTISGRVGQLWDGQNRIGGPFPPGKYSLCNGGVTDANGRGCILTPPTTQWQCDQGASPTGGFSISSSGLLLHSGSSTFWSCPTGDRGSWNIYAAPLKGEPKCTKVTLQTNCRPVKPPTTKPPTTKPPAKSCPADLNGAYEFPHLIVPVDSSQPNKAFGTQYFATITPSVSTIFNFDIPVSDGGKTCSLIFLLPKQSELQTSSFTLKNNSGQIAFAGLNGYATQQTTYNNRPGKKDDYGVAKVTPGTSVVVKTWPCPAGQKVGFSMESRGGTELKYFQDFNPKPIGLYIRKC